MFCLTLRQQRAYKKSQARISLSRRETINFTDGARKKAIKQRLANEIPHFHEPKVSSVFYDDEQH